MYYLYNGRIENTNKKAVELYAEWIIKSDGYSQDTLQDEGDFTVIFTLVDYDVWICNPFDLRFEENVKTGRIEKSAFKKAKEVLEDLICYESLQ